MFNCLESRLDEEFRLIEDSNKVQKIKSKLLWPWQDSGVRTLNQINEAFSKVIDTSGINLCFYLEAEVFSLPNDDVLRFCLYKGSSGVGMRYLVYIDPRDC